MNSDDDTRPDEPAPAAAPAPTPAPAAAAAAIDRYGPALEHLAAEMLRERRRDRRWRITMRLLWLGFLMALAWAFVAQRIKATTPTGPHTALVEVRGEISNETEASAENINAALKSAFEERTAQAIVLRFNSPGGSPVQAGLVNDEIRRLRGIHHKKVYAVCEEMCASGAYYIAAAADEIYVDKASIIGSIGVLMDGFGFTGTMDKLGVERRLITAGDNKGMLDPFSPENPKQRAYAQAMIDQIHQQFIRVVRDGRGKRLKEGPDTFSGLFWNGEQAVRMGLADKYGSLDFIAREVVKAEDVIDYTPKENVAERLVKRFGASIGESMAHSLRWSASVR